MDATKLLKKDHATVKHLFEQYEKARDCPLQNKRNLLVQIRITLTIHSESEEEIFWRRP